MKGNRVCSVSIVIGHIIWHEPVNEVRMERLVDLAFRFSHCHQV